MAAKKKRQAISADILRDVRCELTDDFGLLGDIVNDLKKACDESTPNAIAARLADQVAWNFTMLRDHFDTYLVRCCRFRVWAKENEVAK